MPILAGPSLSMQNSGYDVYGESGVFISNKGLTLHGWVVIFRGGHISHAQCGNLAPLPRDSSREPARRVF